MSLRTKLLVLFALLGVAPLCALGLATHRQTMRALEAVLERQTSTIAERAAQEIAERYRVQRSDMLLLAENEETQRVLRARAAGDTAGARIALDQAIPYFDQLWQQFSHSYHALELRDADGVLLHRLGTASQTSGEDAPRLQRSFRFPQSITDAESGALFGHVVAFPHASHLLPEEVLAVRFGASGYNFVIDRTTGRTLYDGRVTHPMSDTARVTSEVVLAEPQWTVISTTTIGEFAPPFRRMLSQGLAVLLFVILAVSLAFIIAIRRPMRSLAALTTAADAVGRGDFSPDLPPGGNDEIGRLATAFRLMTGKVSDMMAQIERSRQMAAIGEFAAEIAHEVRNPLTSIKLNLQRIKRMLAADGTAPATRPLDISLRAIHRLERVVGGVLLLGRPRALKRQAISLHRTIAAALDTIGSQASRQRVRIEYDFAATRDIVCMDAAQLEAALLNLLVNAVEAMPSGGRLKVATAVEHSEAGEHIIVRITDTGSGIPEAERERLFRPFHTTKPNGTGLGLATALRTVEEHGGSLALEPANEIQTGSTFRIELPIAHSGAHSKVFA